MPSAGFEPATPTTKRPQTYTLDRAATEVGIFTIYCSYINKINTISKVGSNGKI
jgi:hypothetical protein